MKKVYFIIALFAIANVTVVFGQIAHPYYPNYWTRQSNTIQESELSIENSKRNARHKVVNLEENAFYILIEKQENAGILLIKLNNALKIATKNKNIKCVKTGINRVYHVDPGTFRVKKRKNGSEEYIGEFYKYSFRISNKYIFISNHRLNINYSNGLFSSTNSKKISILEDFMTWTLEDIKN